MDSFIIPLRRRSTDLVATSFHLTQQQLHLSDPTQVAYVPPYFLLFLVISCYSFFNVNRPRTENLLDLLRSSKVLPLFAIDQRSEVTVTQRLDAYLDAQIYLMPLHA